MMMVMMTMIVTKCNDDVDATYDSNENDNDSWQPYAM